MTRQTLVLAGASCLACALLVGGCGDDGDAASSSGQDARAGAAGTGGAGGANPTAGTGGLGGTAGESGSGGWTGGDPCPTDSYVNCANDCSGRSAGCDGGACPAYDMALFVSAFDDPWTMWIRTPEAADACSCPSGRRFLAIQNVNDVDSFTVRVTVSEPWFIVESGDDCDAAVEGQCAVRSGTSHRVVVATDDATALPRNVRFDLALPNPTCP